ncbi:methyltransferase-like protein 27 [Lates japonicus]|uniref:Methyltransferase-like protein 27 n=1 Tax=Lates japonicus TaxID=270547 RepID=A0AAD3QZ13_LATJO|nr:methyltransferase-like protein 27 [Lates japonicus]
MISPSLTEQEIMMHLESCDEDEIKTDLSNSTHVSEFDFRHFVGIDASKSRLKEAAKTSLYEDLKLSKLGAER